ncbi:hypothetical protein Tco_0597691 [Tanacetum coccineum]
MSALAFNLPRSSLSFVGIGFWRVTGSSTKLEFLCAKGEIRELWRISALSEQLQQECDSFVQQRHSAEEFSERSSRG